MRGEEAAGYGKPPVSARFKKGQTGNPDGRTKEYHPPFDPGIILQKIESERISVLSNGKRKQMSKAEVEFRQLFNKAAGGDMEAAKTVLRMAKRYFAPEDEDEVEQIAHFMLAKQYDRWWKNRKRRQEPQLVSRSILFRKIAQERVTIEIEGHKTKRTIFEGILRRISTMALNKDAAASKLLEVARKQFPGIQRRVREIVYIGTEADFKL